MRRDYNLNIKDKVTAVDIDGELIRGVIALISFTCFGYIDFIGIVNKGGFLVVIKESLLPTIRKDS